MDSNDKSIVSITLEKGYKLVQEKKDKDDTPRYHRIAITKGNRMDLLEAQTREQERVIKGLENRNNKLEEYVRNTLVEHEKANKGLWTSLGLAMFSIVLTVVTNILFK